MAIKFLNTVQVDTDVLYVDAANDRVGIGTESPDQQLEILYPSYINKDTVEGLLRLTGQSNTENAGDVPSAGVGIEFYNKWTGGLPYSIGRISARASQSYDGGLQFDVAQNSAPGQSNFITAMTILDTGNVGIGTTSPSSKLHVEGSATVGNYAAYIHNASGGGNVLKLYNHDWDTSDYLLHATNGGTAGNGYGFTVDGNARVNIGLATVATANAAADDLHLRSLGSNGITISSGNAQTGTIFFGDVANAAAAGFRYNHNTGDMAISAEDNITFACDNVGIGTTNPSEKLEVAGTIKSISTGAAHLILNGDTNNSGDVGQVDSIIDLLGDGDPGIYGYRINTENWSGQTALNFQEYLNGSYTSRLFISKDGNVGIGVTGPSEKLEVAGNIKIQAALLSNQENTDVDTGAEVVAQVAIATYTAAFFDFVVKKTTNVRSGTVYACHDGTSVVFTETSTNDLGDTSDVTLSVDISGTNMRLLATVTSDDWSVKSLIRAI